ncbi:MAG: LysM peptidoglycan-binding domain-containing protein, partial [Oscillospiraceae bacterium]|nr:LysM peptidoglycan-binding domain-containing protein [Oscillospiraceae bacterium]
PVMCENDSVFEYKVSCGDDIECCYFEPDINISGCNYTMSGENCVDVTAELTIEGEILKKSEKTVITDIKIDSECKKNCSESCALKLYFAEENEDIWEIAKRNSTSVKAILEENNITADKIFEKGMLLIPIIS